MSGDTVGRYDAKIVGNTPVEGHTVYIIKVTSPDGDTWNLQKRYKELRELHDQMRPKHGDALPQFPGKRIFGNQDPTFVAERQAGLQAYLDAVLRIEREIRTPFLLKFLGGPPQQGERNQARQYQQILDAMQSRLLNLALPPPPLDENDMALRLKKYGQAMKLYVLSHPVDPIHLRSPGFDGEPPSLCSTNVENFDALKMPAAEGDMQFLSGALDRLQDVLKPAQPVADAETLIVQFPKINSAQTA